MNPTHTLRPLALGLATAGLALGMAGPAAAQDSAGPETVTETRCAAASFGVELEIGNPMTAAVALALPAGPVSVSGSSSDTHQWREATIQLAEQWDLQFLAADGSVLATSSPTADLVDEQHEAAWSGGMGTVDLPTGVTAVRARHRGDLGGHDSPNSVTAVGVEICWQETVVIEPEPTTTTTEAPPTTAAPTTAAPVVDDPDPEAEGVAARPNESGTTTTTEVAPTTEAPTSEAPTTIAVAPTTVAVAPAQRDTLPVTGSESTVYAAVGTALLAADIATTRHAARRA